MISVKKFHYKRISVIILAILFSFCLCSLVVTKLVYDHIFTRYEVSPEIPAPLQSTVDTRRICQFASGDAMLTGYYYAAQPNEADALVVFVPGFHAGGDDYLWQIRELMDYGWDVFTFDTTGTFRSQGESQIGFSQSLLDLQAALDYLNTQQKFGHSQLVLMGHSRGAYAVCCALPQAQDVAAAVSISGVNSAMESVMESSVQAAGPVSYGNYGFLWLYQASIFGADTLNLEAADAISQTDTPVLVIHGSQDPSTSASIFSHQSQILSPQVEYLLYDAGHTDVLYDPDGTASDGMICQIHEFLLRSIPK